MEKINLKDLFFAKSLEAHKIRKSLYPYYPIRDIKEN